MPADKVKPYLREHELRQLRVDISNQLMSVSVRAIRSGTITPEDLRFLAAYGNIYLNKYWLNKVRPRWVHLMARVIALSELINTLEHDLVSVSPECELALFKQAAENYNEFCHTPEGLGIIRPNFQVGTYVHQAAEA